MVEEVEYYLDNILGKRLDNFLVTDKKMVIDNVRVQIYSLLYNWNDTKVRNSILLTGLEEGIFYLPNANDYIRSFVVVAIRNSYIETLGSCSYQRFSNKSPILDSEIMEITKEAINYFKKLDFSNLSLKVNLSSDEDYYGKIINKYKNSYQVLKILANSNRNEVYFDKIEISKYSNIFMNGINMDFENSIRVIEDGYSNEIGIELIQAILLCMKKDIPFVTNSFKHITRNFEKLLRVIQFLLENDMILVTGNYYISNGYVARRNKLLRVPHTKDECDLQFRNLTGLSKKHAKIINDVRRKLN